MKFYGWMVVCLWLFAAHVAWAGSVVHFKKDSDRVVIFIGGGRVVADYVFADPRVGRPYFANVKTLGGIPVTRNYPPKPEDAQDHVGLHTGIWLAFGDISGTDYWRLKAKVEHAGFVEDPKAGDEHGNWAVRNRYLSADGSQVVCEEVCKYTVEVRSDGYLLTSDSRFTSEKGDFWFGEQDEMGLAIRVATPLVVKSNQGGRIVDSEGRKNELEIWGKVADWVDYGGVIGGRHVGMAILSHSGNPNRSWHHARDYGFVAANPFPRTDGKGRTIVRKGEVFRLRYGVLVYDVAEGTLPDIAGEYRGFVAK